MTEHFKKRLEDAALEVRNAKARIESADCSIGSHEQSIESSRSSIAQSHVSIQSSEAAIAATKRVIQRITEARDRDCFKYEQAQRRLSFLSSELALHPHADL